MLPPMTPRALLLLVSASAVLLALAAPTQADAALGSSCTADEVVAVCAFLCDAGETVHVSASVTITTNHGSAVAGVATCADAAAACDATAENYRFASCAASSARPTRAAGVGTCEAAGFASVRVTCSAA